MHSNKQQKICLDHLPTQIPQRQDSCENYINGPLNISNDTRCSRRKQYRCLQYSKQCNKTIVALLNLMSISMFQTVFILTLMSYQLPTYGKYEFPNYASIIGWSFAVIPLLPLPVYMSIAVRKHTSVHSPKKVTYDFTFSGPKDEIQYWAYPLRGSQSNGHI